jgi:hypothetical protein
MTHRNQPRRHQNRSRPLAPGTAWKKPTYWPCDVRCTGGVNLFRVFVRNLRTWLAMAREKAQADEPRGRKYRCAGAGADCSVVAVKRGNACGAKGAGHPRRDRWVNWQQEEPAGFGGRRQPSLGGTSRVNREVYARFCERLGVRFPGPTRRVGRATCVTLSPTLPAQYEASYRAATERSGFGPGGRYATVFEKPCSKLLSTQMPDGFCECATSTFGITRASSFAGVSWE